MSSYDGAVSWVQMVFILINLNLTRARPVLNPGNFVWTNLSLAKYWHIQANSLSKYFLSNLLHNLVTNMYPWGGSFVIQGTSFQQSWMSLSHWRHILFLLVRWFYWSCLNENGCCPTDRRSNIRRQLVHVYSWYRTISLVQNWLIGWNACRNRHTDKSSFMYQYYIYIYIYI